jgi:hypothetical protein
MTKVREIKEWPVLIKTIGSETIGGRLCVIRKDEHSALKAQRKSIRKANKNSAKLQPETLFFTKYILLLTTFPDKYSASEIFDLYRLRWQIELVFKRFKQIARFGHLPKYDDDSSKAWLYGKLLAALLVEKIIAYAGAISPWRSAHMENESPAKHLERICFCIPPCG